VSVYQDKLRQLVTTLGDNAWVAEYEFANIDQATQAGHFVVERIPELRTLAASLEADLVVADFAGGSRLFFGGLLSDETVSAAHRAVLDQGGSFCVAHQPPHSTLILTPSGVDAGTAPTLEEALVASANDSVEPTPEAAGGLCAEPQPHPVDQLKDFASHIDPNDWVLEYSFEFHVTGERLATDVPKHPWLADLVQAGRVHAVAIEMDGRSSVHVAGPFSHVQLIGIHKWMIAEGAFRRCRPPADAGAEALEIQQSLFGLMPVAVRPWWRFWA
jgi:hypothetical protein